jgi:hypothetical protein
MNTQIKRSIVLFALLVLAGNAAMTQQTKRNLIANSCFEDNFKNWRWDGDPIKGELKFDTENPISGATSAKITVHENAASTWDLNLYTFLPIEEAAIYKVTFKAKASAEASFKLEVCESHGGDNYKPIELSAWPDGWIKEDAASDRLRGTVAVGTEVREYTFITAGSQWAYPNYTLAFHFGKATPNVDYWLDDIKISRHDDGDWDGNMIPTGNFESNRPFANGAMGFWLDAFVETNGSTAAISDGEAISGQRSAHFYKSPTAPVNEPFWGLSYHFQFWNNETATYRYTFKGKSQPATKLMMRLHTQPWAFIGYDLAQCEIDLTPEVQSFALDRNNSLSGELDICTPDYDRVGGYIGKQSLFGSLLSPITAGGSEIWIDDVCVRETVSLLDYEILNVPASLQVGATAQLKTGEFVTPTHAPATVEFAVFDGTGSASIDRNGVLTGIAEGTVIVSVTTPELTAEKTFQVDIIAANSLPEEIEASKIVLSKTVVSPGEDIIVSSPFPVRIDVYSALGVPVSKGNTTGTIRTRALPAGIYQVQITAGTGIHTVRRMVVK